MRFLANGERFDVETLTEKGQIRCSAVEKSVAIGRHRHDRRKMTRSQLALGAEARDRISSSSNSKPIEVFEVPLQDLGGAV